MSIYVKPGTQSGHIHKVAGKGVLNDLLYVRIEVEVPKKISKEENKLLNELKTLREKK